MFTMVFVMFFLLSHSPFTLPAQLTYIRAFDDNKHTTRQKKDKSRSGVEASELISSLTKVKIEHWLALMERDKAYQNLLGLF